ncbi:MAG TPA: DUF1156 domain-containing protein [Terriglobales bacterium]|nr:DUF1156 domain-containing protein [Terriglobales bacterium]
MSDTPKKRLIEVNFPLKEVSEESVRDPNIRQGHVRTLHIWWARRPLAASRATALASLLFDVPQKREEMLHLVADISPWDSVAKDTPQNRALLQHARDLILDDNNGQPPKVLDCFGGGGAIPLEAMRLGCEVHALDYNPVAILLLKAILEFPQRFGKRKFLQGVSGTLGIQSRQAVNPLLEEVRTRGNQILEQVRNELEQFYPRDKDGSITVGYIWARTVPCQSAECGAEVPLLRQLWLVKKEGKKIALRFAPDKKTRHVGFQIVEGKEIDFDPDEGTVSRAHVRCPLCASTIDDETTRRLFCEGKSGQRMVAVVQLLKSNREGKTYRLPNEADITAFRAAEAALQRKCDALKNDWGMNPIPDERLQRVPISFGIINVWAYGMNSWGTLFNPRQLLALIIFSDKVRNLEHEITLAGAERPFARAVATYLGLTVSRLSNRMSSLAYWFIPGEKIQPTFVRPALGMVWDYIELNPFNDASGGWCTNLSDILNAIDHLCNIEGIPGEVIHGDAAELPWQNAQFDAVLTDPPYYDNVPYSYISDFFYVWLKRMLGTAYPELFTTPLTPKSHEIVAYMNGEGVEGAKKRFEQRLTAAFAEMHRVLKPEGIAVIVFAYPKTDAWEAVIKALLNARLFMTASWPIHTEMQSRLRAQEAAALASSIYMVCRKRTTAEIGEFSEVRQAIETRVRQQLDKFWNEGIRGADFFMSAIGPAVEVFGRYEKVEKLSGEIVEVRELLDYVERVVSEFALQRILGSTELGGVDTETRFYLLWRWTYGNARVPFDEGNKLALAVGTELKSLWDKGGIVSKEKDYVRVLGPRDREKDRKFLDQIGFNAMVDALHRACIYWERGERKQLKELLAQTYGSNNTFWRVAQNIANVLPEGDKEKQLLQGLLNVPEAKDKVAIGSGKLFSD